MDRFALIIESSNVKGLDDLPGARKDVESWCRFLASNAGGAWSSDEIKILNKPSSSLVSYYLDLHQQAYCFVAYSGHGCEVKRNSWDTKGVPHVCLNDDEKRVALSSLTPRGLYGTLISDSCRGHEIGQQITANFSRKASALTLSADSIDYSPIYHKQLWFNALEQCKTNQGVVTMYSCASGQSADENPDAGGLYTSLLIKKGDFWYANASSNYYYTTWNAHEDAAQWMHTNTPQQSPEYKDYPRAFPFAVKA